MESVSRSAADLFPLAELRLNSLLPIPYGDGAHPDPVPQISQVGQGDRPRNPGIARDVYPTGNGFLGEVTIKPSNTSVRVRKTDDPSVRIRRPVGAGTVVVGVDLLPREVRPGIGFVSGGAGVNHEQRFPFSGGSPTGVTDVRVQLVPGLTVGGTHVNRPGEGRDQVDVVVALNKKDFQITGVQTLQRSGWGVVVQQKIGTDGSVTGEVNHGGPRGTGRDETVVRASVILRF